MTPSAGMRPVFGQRVCLAMRIASLSSPHGGRRWRRRSRSGSPTWPDSHPPPALTTISEHDYPAYVSPAAESTTEPPAVGTGDADAGATHRVSVSRGSLQPQARCLSGFTRFVASWSADASGSGRRVGIALAPTAVRGEARHSSMLSATTFWSFVREFSPHEVRSGQTRRVVGRRRASGDGARPARCFGHGLHTGAPNL